MPLTERLSELEELTLRQEITDVESAAASVIIVDDVSYATAGEITKQIKRAQKNVKDYFKPLHDTAYEAYKAVNDKQKEMLDPLTNAEKILKGKMTDYHTEVQRKAREAEFERQRALEEAARQAMAEAVKQEANGNTGAAEMALAEAAFLEQRKATVTESVKPKADGVSTVKTWAIKNIDLTKVPTEIAGVVIRPR